ncbi:MAG TPA: methyltransferase domain-containing protein [Methylovirgula sp.]|nr:methyltransferase domain-containing protein [Methylovirgula sp.]
MEQAHVAAEAKAAFVLGLRGRGIRNLALLRALERVPREIFVPHRYTDLARRDLALPIGCGQTLSEPWLIARMIEALAPGPEHNVLEVGTGSGYGTAILAEIGRSVVSLERFQTLAIAARLRLENIGLANARVVMADGLALPSDAGPFDRIILHGAVTELPPQITGRVTPGGKIVFAKPDPTAEWRQVLIEATLTQEGQLIERTRGACRLQRLLPGLARIL